MSDTPTTVQDALAALRQRAKEHDGSRYEADHEYAAGIRDAITALEPFLTTVSSEVVGYLYGTALLHPDDAPVGEPDCEALGRILPLALAPKPAESAVKGTGVSKLQQEVLDRLAAGWQLGVSSHLIGGRVWLQKDGLGKGGETKKVRRQVFDALVASKRIVRTDNLDATTMVYVLASEAQP